MNRSHFLSKMLAQVFALCQFASALASAPSRTPVGGIPYEASYEVKPQPYSFNFDVKDGYGTALTRQEHGDELGNKKGSYGYIDAYGISRLVEYVADNKGFRATIKTNEPGTDNQNPADVEIQSNAVLYQGRLSYASSSAASVYNHKAESDYGTADPGINGPASVNRQPILRAYSTSAGDRVLPSANRSPVSQLHRSSVYEERVAPNRISSRSYISAVTTNTQPELFPRYGEQVVRNERVSPRSSAVTSNAQPVQSFPNGVQTASVNVPLNSNNSTGSLSTGLRTNA